MSTPERIEHYILTMRVPPTNYTPNIYRNVTHEKLREVVHISDGWIGIKSGWGVTQHLDEPVLYDIHDDKGRALWSGHTGGGFPGQNDKFRAIVAAQDALRAPTLEKADADHGHVVFENVMGGVATTVFCDDQGQLHREKGPAVIQNDGDITEETWMRHGKEHRVDGPSHYVCDSLDPDCRRWYRDGVTLSPEERTREERVYTHIREAYQSEKGDQGPDWQRGYRQMAMELAGGNKERAASIIVTARELAEQEGEVPALTPTTHAKETER